MKTYIDKRYCDHCKCYRLHLCKDSKLSEESFKEYEECTFCRCHKYTFINQMFKPIDIQDDIQYAPLTQYDSEEYANIIRKSI